MRSPYKLSDKDRTSFSEAEKRARGELTPEQEHKLRTLAFWCGPYVWEDAALTALASRGLVERTKRRYNEVNLLITGWKISPAGVAWLRRNRKLLVPWRRVEWRH